jgi:molecular chaperone DnaK (HSP70)
MVEQVVHLPSQEQASRSLVAGVAVAATAVIQATPLPQVVTAAQVVAVTVVPRHGTEPVALQAPALAALSTQAVAAAVVPIALAPK